MDSANGLSSVLCCPAAVCSFLQTSSPTITVLISGGKFPASEVALVSETGAKMVCEAAASRTDDVETVGITETDASSQSETGTERVGTDIEMVDASEDKGIG